VTADRMIICSIFKTCNITSWHWSFSETLVATCPTRY